MKILYDRFYFGLMIYHSTLIATCVFDMTYFNLSIDVNTYETFSKSL